MFFFDCGIGEPYPLCDISLHVLFFISRPLRSSPQRTQRKATFPSNREIPIVGKILSATGAKGFQTQEVYRRHESFSPIGISPIGEKFHSLRSLRSLCETSFHLVAAMLRCVLCMRWIFLNPSSYLILSHRCGNCVRLWGTRLSILPLYMMQMP